MLEGPCSLSCTEAMLLVPVVFQLVQSKRVAFWFDFEMVTELHVNVTDLILGKLAHHHKLIRIIVIACLIDVLSNTMLLVLEMSLEVTDRCLYT